MCKTSESLIKQLNYCMLDSILKWHCIPFLQSVDCFRLQIDRGGLIAIAASCGNLKRLEHLYGASGMAMLLDFLQSCLISQRGCGQVVLYFLIVL